MSVSELEQLRLKLYRDGATGSTPDRTYDIYPVQNVDIASQKDAFSISPPGLAATDNILLGVGGMQADITIDAQVWDDGSDRSDGSHTSTVITTAEQNKYLEDVIHDPGFEAAWELDHPTGAAFNDDEVFVESIDLNPIDRETPKWDEISIRLRRGRSIG